MPLASCEGPPLRLTDDDPRTLPAALLRAAERFGDVGTVTEGHLGYADLLDTARRRLGGLRSRGVSAGDSVVLHGLRLPDVFPVFWACVLGGVRPALISDPTATERLANTCSLLRPAMVISSLDDLPPTPVAAVHEPDWQDTAMFMLSSGSTGAPKAIRITHRGFAEFAAATATRLPVTPGEVMLNWLPVDHSGALFLYHVLAVFTGCTNVHAPTEAVLADPLLWLDLMDRHGAHHTWAPTFGLRLAADALASTDRGGWDLSGLRSLVSGGEQIPEPVVERFFEATEPFGLRRRVFRPAWGMAETVTAITIGRYTDPGGVHRIRKSSLAAELVAAGEDEPAHESVTFVAVGPPSPGAAIRVVSDDDVVLPERHIGRLQVRSPRLTPGYVGGEPLPGDGWLRTDDLAFVDAGQVVITGREQDVIIINGHNHFCHEIELVAGSVDGVVPGGVGAVGMPDERTGTEALVVCFTPSAGPDGEADDAVVAGRIREALFGRLRLIASEVVAVPGHEFPQTGSGKVRRGELRRRLLRRRAAARAVPADRVAAVIADVLGRPVDADTPFYELGMTSVTLVRARARLAGELGVAIEPTALFEHPTVTALAAHLSGAPPAPPAGPARPVTRARPVMRARPGGEVRADAEDRRVAVIGMAVRFPGASTVEQFWTNLVGGVCSVERFDRSGPADLVPVGGVIEDVSAFDPAFFGIPDREAELMDPAHRLFLQCCYHALEDGGHAAARPGTRIGVYAGCGMNLYGHQAPPAGHAPPDDLVTAMQATIGAQPDFLASRVAYRLGLSGPAVGVQTACSTALVAVHLAVQALQAGDADLALAGAAAVNLPQDGGYRAHPGSILSPSGRCRAFDADADGTVGGNGVAVVLLKPLPAAVADGDTVHAVILGSAINNDGGRKVGFAAPSVSGQVDVITAALERAGVPASTIGYVEAHGTGTRLGDPVEFEALRQAFAGAAPGSCTVGTVKPNVGHLDSCAGMAGLIKTVLMLRHGQLVPLVGLERPNPELRLDGGPFVLGTSSRPWVAPVRRAGVSAFGVGGTNAHVVLEQPPPPAPPTDAPTGEFAVLALSARGRGPLTELARSVRDRLAAPDPPAVADVVATLAARPHLPDRLAVAGRSAGELVRALDEAIAADPGETGPMRPLAFAFAGQGAARPGMAAELYRQFDVVREVLDECDRVHRAEFGGGLLDALRTPGPPDGIWPTDIAQPALFAYGVALARWFVSVGIEPDLVVGHSVGEFAALCVAGAVTLADGLRMCATRGRLMRADSPAGGMLAVRAEPAFVTDLARSCGLDVAVVNGSRSFVLAGAPAAVERAAGSLAGSGVPHRRLAVDRAFHSALLDPILPALRRAAAGVAFTPLRRPLASGLDGRLLPVGTVLDAAYVCDQARRATRFDLALAALESAGCRGFVDLGPGDVVTGVGSAALPGSLWLSAQPRGSDPVPGIGRVLAELYRHGLDLDWTALAGDGRRIGMPLYPFERRLFGPPSTAPAQAPSPAPTPSPSPAPAPAPAPQVPAPSSTADEPTMPTDVPAGGPDVLHGVRALTAGRLGTDPAALDVDSTFLRLGADSLVLMGLTRDLDDRFGVKVPVRELFAGADTPRRLAGLLAARTGTGRPPAAPPKPKPEPEPEPERTAPSAATEGLDGGRPNGIDGRTQDTEGAVASVVRQQLRLTERLVDRVTGLMERQLAMLDGRTPVTAPVPPKAPPGTSSPEPLPAPAASTRASPVEPAGAPPEPAHPPGTGRPCAFSLYFFGDYPDRQRTDKYELIVEAARFGDRHGFHTLWLPERHFHSFGALFPNPSVLAAALAAHTKRIRLHAGSVVLPLHSAFRVAEEWSVVDNLSGGRVGLCVASGWHANDFVLAPERFGRHRELMYEQLDTVRRLWAGDEVEATSGSGERISVRVHPAPLQARPPMFAAVVGNPQSYRKAAAHDLGIVTNLMAQSVGQLAENVALYRRARAEHGLDPDAGRVVVLMHSYLGGDLDRVRDEAFEPFCGYLRSSLSLFNQVTNSLGFEMDLDATPEDDVAFMLEQAYRRYCESRALIGTVSSCSAVVDAVVEAGADEIAGFVDFGVDPAKVIAALPALDALRRRHLPRPSVRVAVDGTRPGPAAEPPGPTPEPTEPTPAQRRIWFLERMYPGQLGYHEPKAIRLDGPLDVERLVGALRRVVERQPALRTVFREIDGSPRRLVLERMEVDCPVVDLVGRDEDDALREVLRGEGRTVLDLSNGPLLLARLLRLSDTRHVLFMSAHHIVFDSSSTAVFTRDLAAFYRAWPGTPTDLPALPAPPPSSDRFGDTGADLDFWRTELAGAAPLRLPTDRPRPPVRSGAGASLTHQLDAELTARMRRFAREHGVTMFATLLTAVGAVLGRFGGQDDLVVGTAVADRPPGTEHAVGLYLDTVPLRIRLGRPPGSDARPGFGALARRVFDTGVRAIDHRHVQFDELVGALNPDRDPGRNPLFDVMVEFENAEHVEFDPPNLTATLLDVPTDRAPFDLSVYLSQRRDTVGCMVEYSTDLFDEPTVRRLLDYVEHVLRTGVENPDAPLRVTPTGADERRLAGWRGAIDPAGRRRPAPCLHELFERAADTDPTATAVITTTGTIGYAELDRMANRLANRLAERPGSRRGELVAVCLPRGPELIAALLGVLKAGAGYVPLDPGLPHARRRFMLDDSAATAIVTHRGLLAELPDRPTAVLVEDLAGAPDHRPATAITADDIAYCIYTSGSTGRPKGVLLTHRGPANVVAWQARQHPPLRTLQWTSTAFDISVQEIFSTLAAGAALVVVDEPTRYDPAAVAEVMRRHEVQRLFMPFTPLKYLARSRPRLPSLRLICSAGEAIEVTPALRRFLTEHPAAELHNHYGPTEASLIVSSHRVDPDAGVWPPIGRPVDNVRIDVLDADGDPVPVGAVGEICVSGDAVAVGYLGRPAETAAVFRPGPAGRLYRTGDLGRVHDDGVLRYLGRLDDQVKIRGHRVEPGEVRRAIAAVPGVRDVAVLARPDRNGEQRLIAYVALDGPGADGAEGRADGGIGGDLGRVADELARSLPGHLVPQDWVRLDRLPVNASGKLDRARLPEPRAGAATTATLAPRTDLERRLHELWCAELGVERVGVDQPFFRLGGHSLTAVRLLNRVRERLGIDYSLTDFFRAPTIGAMAAAAEPPAHVVDQVPLCGMQTRTWRLHHRHEFPAIYNVAHRVDLRGPLDPDALRRAFATLVSRHAALRSRVVDAGMQVLAEVPVELPVTDMRDDAVPRWCARTAERVFDLERGPLFRLALARLTGDRWVLVVVLNHLVCDGWSMHLIWDELAALYAGADAPPAPQFPDYARWQHELLAGDAAARLDEFWRETLDGAPPCLDLPYDHARPPRLSGRGALHVEPVPADLRDRVGATAAAAGTTPYVVLGAAFARWASRLTGQPDLVVTISNANRNRGEHERIVGEIGDVVPIRIRPPHDATDLLAEYATRLYAAMDHAVPFDRLIPLLGPPLEPYPQVLFSVVTTPPPVLALPGLDCTVAGLPITGVARSELYVVVTGDTLFIEYSTDLFEADTIAGWARSLLGTVDELAADVSQAAR